MNGRSSYFKYMYISYFIIEKNLKYGKKKKPEFLNFEILHLDRSVNGRSFYFKYIYILYFIIEKI